MKTALEILGKHEGQLRHYSNDIHYVRKDDALKAMEEYAEREANRFDALVRTEWVAVKDRLPPEYQKVLLYNDHYKLRVGYYTSDTNTKYQWAFSRESAYVGETTHWMELPNNPEA